MTNHLQNERQKELASLNDFDPTLTQARPQHDAFSKAQRALKQHLELCQLEAMVQAGTIMLEAGRPLVCHGDGLPDKPGTVRKPGVRRQFGSNRKQRWAAY